MHAQAISFNGDDPLFAALYEDVPAWSFRFGTLLLSHLKLTAGLQVLDVGCGTGYPLFEMAYYTGPASQFVGLDVWGAAIQRAEQRRRYWAMDHVSLVTLEGDHYPFPDGSFDLITSNLGINNFANPPAVLAECVRVLKPGGRIAITTNFKGHMQEFYAIFRAVLIDLAPHYLPNLTAHEDHRGTPQTHRALLENAGLVIEQAVKDQFTLRYLDGTALVHHPLIRFGFLPAWVDLIAEADRARIFGQLEQRLNEAARQNGELRLTIPMLYLSGRLA